MPQRILSSLSWKAGLAVAATVIAAGAGATTVHLASDSHAADHPAVDVQSEHPTTTTTTDGSDADDDDSNSADVTAKSATTPTTTHEHPDNFGATVSADAQDGGVDGQEISDAAHAKNEQRRLNADHPTADDHPEADEADDEGDDHRSDQGTEKGQDDSHPEDDGTDD